jgi:ParB family chromosome partitioning protein
MGTIFRLSLREITVPERLRPIDEAHVLQTAASMEEQGQLSPIVARKLGAGYTLVAGAHRLAAAERLGWDVIEAHIVSCDDDEARLIEIDENLVRRELSALDRAIFLAERKRVWERMYPETAHGKAKKGKVANIATFMRFSKDAAKNTGLSERAIQLASSIIARLDHEAVSLLRLHPLAKNQAQLKALSELEREEQRAVAAKIASGDESTVTGARIALGYLARRNIDPEEAAFERFIAIYLRGSRTLRRRMRAYLAETPDEVEEP